MISRQRMLAKSKIDYEYEANKPMCEGCNKASGTLIHYCRMYDRVPPGMYILADECPANPRKRPPVGSKIRVGQGKTKSGGNA